MSIYHERRIENLESQKLELNHEIERGRKLIERLHSEVDRLKGQLRILQNAKSVTESETISFEKFYLKDLVSKVN